MAIKHEWLAILLQTLVIAGWVFWSYTTTQVEIAIVKTEARLTMERLDRIQQQLEALRAPHP